MTMTAIVNGVTLIEEINTDANLYKVDFDNGESLYWVAAPNEPSKYLNQEVEVETRKDIVNGKLEDFVANIATQQVVNKLGRAKSFKLFAENIDNNSSIAFRDIELGQTYMNCVLYCSKMRYDASAKADWINLTVSDKYRRVSSLRIFSPDVQGANYAGKYIRCDIRKNKYGLTTDSIFVLDREYARNPELDLAEEYITSQFSADANFTKLLDSTNIIPYLANYVGYEAGSLLLDAAMAIDIAHELANVTPGINTDAIKQAFIMDKSWVLTTNTKYSNEFLSVYNCVKYKALVNPLVTEIIDEHSPSDIPEKFIYANIKALVKSLVRARKDIDPDEVD